MLADDSKSGLTIYEKKTFKSSHWLTVLAPAKYHKTDNLPLSARLVELKKS